jgi:hypothetical protein
MTRDEARSLRADGHTLAAIAELAGVHATTVGRWCQGVLAPAGKGARDTQRHHREAAAAAFEAGRWEALALIDEPLWVAGTTMYWGEGAKSNHLGLANTDPEAIRLFEEWVLAHHDPRAEFTIRLHLHQGHDEERSTAWWLAQITSAASVGKTYWKPAGTGHRNKVLPHGICTLRAKRSTLMLARTLGWIDGLKIALPLLRPAA